MENVRDNIRQCIVSNRKRLGLSQKELADMVGAKNLTTVSSWERGISTPDNETLLKLSQIFGVDIGDFYTDTEREINAEQRFISFINAYGYSAIPEKTGQSETGYQEEHTVGDAVVGRSFVPDKEYFEVTVIKDGQSVTFNEEEFKEIQTLMKGVIEAKFYQKLIEHKK